MAKPVDATKRFADHSERDSDTTITPDNLSSALHVEDTSHPLILNVTSLSDAIQAPVSDLQPEVTSTGEPAAQVNHVALPGDVDRQRFGTEPARDCRLSDTTIALDTISGEPAAQVNQVIDRRAGRSA